MMNTLDNAYDLITKLNANIKLVEEAEQYRGILEGDIKLAAVKKVPDAEYDDITYLPIDDEDMVELKALAQKLIMKKADAANEFLKTVTGETVKPEPAPKSVKKPKPSGKLDLDIKKIIKLRDEDGLTFEEIGSRFGCSRSVIYRRYMAAKSN